MWKESEHRAASRLVLRQGWGKTEMSKSVDNIEMDVKETEDGSRVNWTASG
jgi:hypothetical protein